MANKFQRMIKMMPSLYKPEVNTIIGGLLKSWAIADDNVEVEISNTKDQLFEQTAEGRYLDYLGNNVGVPREADLGIGDDDFRKLIPIMSFYPKQVRFTIIALLDVFWGPGFTRANINSGNVETYNFGPTSLLTGTATFNNGDKKVRGIGTLFTVELQPGDYIKVSTTSGYTFQKVSSILSDTMLELSEHWNSDIAVNVMITKGITRELNYIADNGDERAIRFKPNAFNDLTAVTVSELVSFINTNQEHNRYLTASKFVDPVSGNKLNIRTNTPGLLGSIQITGGDANDPSRLDFSLVKQTEVRVNVFEINPNELVIRIPSSVPVLRRSLKGALHPKQTKAEIFSEAEVYDFSGLGASSTLTLDIDGNPYTVTFTHAADFADPSAVTAEEVVDVINDQLDFLTAFTEAPGNFKRVGLRTTEGSVEYQITGGTANTVLIFDTALQTDPDIIDVAYPSAYIFDPIGQLFTVTGTSSDLADTVPSGSVTPSISLTDASSFPNAPGKILFNFGRGEQEGPVGYNSRPNNSTLLIDASHVFQNEHVSGRKVNFITDGPTLPRLTGDDYPVYVVGTEEARAAAQRLIRQLLASGVVIRFVISFPEVLFECVCRECGPPETPDYRGSLTGQGPLVF